MSRRLNEYFVQEASDYLDQLDRLLAQPGMPDADQLLRLATGVRGSAQMADAETVAGVAERLEDAARSIVSKNIAWSEELRHLSQQTVADLKLLVRALNRWGQEEEARVREAIGRWDGMETAREAAAPAPEEVVPISALFFDDEGPHSSRVDAVPASPAAQPAEVAEVGASSGDENGQTAVVAIQTLLLRGDAALEEALALRSAFERIARGDPMPDKSLRELVDELFALLDLARSPEPPAA